MARACATKRSLSSWTSYKKGLVESGKSCGVLVVSPLHAYDGVFTQTSSVKPNPFANVTIKIDVIFTFKLSACANSVYQAFPPRFEGLGTRLRNCMHYIYASAVLLQSIASQHALYASAVLLQSIASQQSEVRAATR